MAVGHGIGIALPDGIPRRSSRLGPSLTSTVARASRGDV